MVASSSRVVARPYDQQNGIPFPVRSAIVLYSTASRLAVRVTQPVAIFFASLSRLLSEILGSIPYTAGNTNCVPYVRTNLDDEWLSQRGKLQNLGHWSICRKVCRLSKEIHCYEQVSSHKEASQMTRVFKQVNLAKLTHCTF